MHDRRPASGVAVEQAPGSLGPWAPMFPPRYPDIRFDFHHILAWANRSAQDAHACFQRLSMSSSDKAADSDTYLRQPPPKLLVLDASYCSGTRYALEVSLAL